MPRALVVEDSRAMRMILSRTLAELGFDVVEAANGRQALECTEQGGASFRIALVDWNMPEATGLEFVEWVRARPAFAGVASCAA